MTRESCDCVPSLGVPPNICYHSFGNGPWHQHTNSDSQHNSSHELCQAPDTRHTIAAETLPQGGSLPPQVACACSSISVYVYMQSHISCVVICCSLGVVRHSHVPLGLPGATFCRHFGTSALGGMLEQTPAWMDEHAALVIPKRNRLAHIACMLMQAWG